jgi:hypothetical protein
MIDYRRGLPSVKRTTIGRSTVGFKEFIMASVDETHTEYICTYKNRRHINVNISSGEILATIFS